MIVFTLRLQRDGGAWNDERAGERESLWRELARQPEIPDFLDVEIEAPGISRSLREEVRGRGLRILLSHHAVASESPESWEAALAAMRPLHPDAVKFAVTVEDRADATALLRFARRVAAEFPLSCVLGMGDAGRATRVAGPLLGCPLAYAFLETGSGPVAPGQLSADALRACFQAAPDRPDIDAAETAWMAWAEARLGALDHAA
jgi:3-dehydroquinate dehydratase-1